MAEQPVVDASPLIFLSRGGYLDLLRQAGEEALVPEPVALEILRRGSGDPTARALETTAWLKVVPAPPIPPAILAWDLGAGESSVLALVQSVPDAVAILDDLAARRCAATLGLSLRGTLGLVLLAKKRGLVPAARPVVEELRRSGMYLSDQVVSRALALVGE